MIFAVSIAARHEDGIEHTAAAIEADDQVGAIRKGHVLARRLFPTHGGWLAHNVAACTTATPIRNPATDPFQIATDANQNAPAESEKAATGECP